MGASKHPAHLLRRKRDLRNGVGDVVVSYTPKNPTERFFVEKRHKIGQRKCNFGNLNAPPTTMLHLLCPATFANHRSSSRFKQNAHSTCENALSPSSIGGRCVPAVKNSRATALYCLISATQFSTLPSFVRLFWMSDVVNRNNASGSPGAFFLI